MWSRVLTSLRPGSDGGDGRGGRGATPNETAPRPSNSNAAPPPTQKVLVVQQPTPEPVVEPPPPSPPSPPPQEDTPRADLPAEPQAESLPEDPDTERDLKAEEPAEGWKSVQRVDPSAMVLVSAVLEGDVTVGADCICHPRCRIRALNGPIVMGESNVVEEFAEITNHSSAPMVIGNWNVFEVGCSVAAQAIGDSNVFEKQSRVEEGCVVGSGCVVGVRSVLLRGTRLHNSVSIAGAEGRVFPLAEELSQMNQELNIDQVRLSKELLPAFHHLQFAD